MIHQPVHITAGGLEKLLLELDFLINVRRVEVAENLHDAQSGGDSIDNTEFQTIQYEQLLLEMRITELQGLIAAADPSEGRISVDCPLGQALLNKTMGEVVSVMTPDGAFHYSILSVS